MKHLLLTTIATVLLVGTAFAGPIHVAAEDGDLAGVQAELDKGVDVNVNNKLVGSGGGTPLHYATTKAIAELLIANGADVNAKVNDGRTPLDWAKSYPEIADLLRKHGGKTGTELALIPRLVQHGALHSALMRKKGRSTRCRIRLTC